MRTILVTASLLLAQSTFAQKPQSISSMTFGDENTLFIADSKSATIFAYEIDEPKNQNEEEYFNIFDLSDKIASLEGINEQDILIREMKIHPISKTAYIAYDTKTINGYDPKVVIANQAGEVKSFDLQNTKHTSKSVVDAPDLDRLYFETLEHRSLTFTDINFFKGKLYISGISNAEFSSSLRVMDYPFNDESTSLTSLEMYHAVHDQNENRAPIVSMDFFEMEGKDYIIAVYLCTPLVVFPLDDIQNGKHVVGKTIAELGYGNLPNDLFWIEKVSMMGVAKFDKGIIITHNQRSATYVSLEDIIKGAQGEAMGKVGLASEGGIPSLDLPVVGHLQSDNQNKNLFVSITRDPATNNLQLLSYNKPMFLRLDDVYFSEYDMPTYNKPMVEKMRKKMTIDPLGKEYVTGKDNQ